MIKDMRKQIAAAERALKELKKTMHPVMAEWHRLDNALCNIEGKEENKVLRAIERLDKIIDKVQEYGESQNVNDGPQF